jgi:hypothetical protein
MNLPDVPRFAAAPTQRHRPIRLNLWVRNAVLDDVLLVKHVRGREALCGGFEYRLLCVATQAGLPLKEFMALPVELQFVTDQGGLRSVCGIVARASAGRSDGGLAAYELVVRDALAKEGGIRADKIKGPAKLYRIVDPSNEGAGIFWMTEEEFKALRNRDEWRERFAVKPDWNQNGWFVEYEIKEGESLAVWRGPAASQELAGTDRYLEGGGEQIVFFPENRDEMVRPLARVDKNTGEELTDWAGSLDRRVEFTDVTGEATPTKLRAKVVDRHIKGPISTGWGAADYTEQEAQRILLTLPASK